MCLAIPGKIFEIDRESKPLMGKANFAGIQKQICLEMTPDAVVGDYVIVHVGFAISKLNESEALKTLNLIEEIEKSEKDNYKSSESKPA